MKLSSLGVKKMLLLVLSTMLIVSGIIADGFFVRSSESADAATSWEVRVTCKRESGYIDKSTTDTVILTDDKSLFFLISGFETSGEYYYAVTTKYYSDISSHIGDADITWNLINPFGSTQSVVENEVTYYVGEYTLSKSESQIYIYFLRRKTVTDGGNTTRIEDPYPGHWFITVDEGLPTEDLGFYGDIACKYIKESKTTDYGGEWISTALNFTITTLYMNKNGTDFNPAHERLSYSLDFNDYYEADLVEAQKTLGEAEAKASALASAAEKANWVPLATNTFALEGYSLSGVAIWFRNTDISGGNAAYKLLTKSGETEALKVRMDPYDPKFTVSAYTYDSQGEEVEYVNRSWTGTKVVFTLTNDSLCPSQIMYKYSDNKTTFSDMGSGVLEVTSSKSSLTFIATNGAGRTYTYDVEYAVNIDSVIPQLYTEAYTIDPDEELEKEKKLGYSVQTVPSLSGAGTSDMIVYDYANGSVTIRLYNRDAAGNPVKNASGVSFMYQEATARMSYTNNWVTLKQDSSYSDGNEICYQIKRDVGSAVSSTRYFRFKIKSGAGITGNEAEVSVTLCNSIFSFSFPENNYLEAKANATGWIADKATVNVILPTDSKAESSGYSLPTTQYTFYYWYSELTGDGSLISKIKSQAGSSVATASSFVKEEDGKVFWLYKFDLVASANAVFNIRAMNAAGKMSSNTLSTYETIKIDVLPPTYEMTAYIYPMDGSFNFSTSDYSKLIKLDIEEPSWVNGSIALIIRVKNGVSGVYLKDREYAKDSEGKPLYDLSGQLSWSEVNEEHTVSETIVEGTEEWYYYYVVLNNSDESTTVMVREYQYRIYTRSGNYIDVSFTAKIDTTPAEQLRLDTVEVTGGKNTHTYPVIARTGILNDENLYFCEDYTVSFTSSLNDDPYTEQDQYSVYYYPFTVDELGIGGEPTQAQLTTFARNRFTNEGFDGFTKLTGSSISGTVALNKRGSVYYAIYIRSNAMSYLGDGDNNENVHVSGPYVLVVNFDTLKITFKYNVTNTGDSGWQKGSVGVTMSLLTDSNENITQKDGYVFYYMLLDGENPDLAKMNNEEDWKLADGIYNSDSEYEFTITFEDISFYGSLGLSVTNRAGYRSVGLASAVVIRIDNTTPEISEIFLDVSGETEHSVLSSKIKLHSVYSNTKIMLDAQLTLADTGRSTVTYYYHYLGTDIDNIPEYNADFSSDVSASEDQKLTKISSVTPLDLFGTVDGFNSAKQFTVYYVLFAHNEVPGDGSGYSGGSVKTLTAAKAEIQCTEVYKFVYDPSALSGELSVDVTAATVDEATNMYAYYWLDTVRVSLKATPNKLGNGDPAEYVKFRFSVDGGNSWFDYIEAGSVKYYTAGSMQELTFTAESIAEYKDADGNYPFMNGVTSVFKFRAQNKAGTYVDVGEVYIAIDETTPEFEILTYDQNGLVYVGGSSSDLSASGVWTSGPITVQIEVTRMPASGITFTYYLQYLDSETGLPVNTAGDSGTGKELLNNQFTTDMLDGFNLNRDAILFITAVNKSKSSNITTVIQSVRLSVDQIVPTFTMTGEAYNDSGSLNGQTGGTIITSGTWVPYDTVEVNKAKTVTNVSPVTYTYTWKDVNMNAPTSPAVWTDTQKKIKKNTTGDLVVTARSAAGLEYKQTFQVKIDTVAPVIKFSGGINPIQNEEYFIDLQVTVEETNIDICEYITVKTETRGFAFEPAGYVLSTSSVDNSIRYDTKGDPYRGYVHIYVKDKAGNTAEFTLYILPFALTVNTITLSYEDQAQVDAYEVMLDKAVAAGYMDDSRITYFRNLISRLRDRTETLKSEIADYQDYLKRLASESSFELRSNYQEMLEYRTTFENYEVYGQKWIQDAITGDSTSIYYAYYKNFLEQFDKLFALKEQVENVEANVAALPAINMVEREDYEDILRVYDEYNNLTDDQRSCFTSNLYNKLMDLKKACEVLLLTSEETGVVLDGSFAPGATIDVKEYTSATETFQNAQRSLLSTVNEDESRVIVSIYRVALTGAFSQTTASDITVQLPIPEDYQKFISFAVYELSDDGSMTKINNMEINPDGETVQFSTTALGIYVLCTTADVEQTETTEDVYGSLFGLELDTKMITYLVYAGAALIVVLLLIMIVLGIRHRRFLNSYNKAYRNSRYRQATKGVPKGNKIK